MFEPLFRIETDIAEGDDVLVMKEIFSCQIANRVIASNKKEDQGINKAVVASKSLSNFANLSGRSIWDNGKTVEKNGKKALALLEASEHQKCYKDGMCPSGKVYEDCLLFMRRAMCKELKGDIVVLEDDDDSSPDRDDDDDVNDDDEEDDMPSSHFFPGFLAFTIWGPIMPPGFDEEHRAQAFFATEQSKDKKKDGRNSIRKEQFDEESKARSCASAVEGSGLSNKEPLMMASIAQQSAFQQAFQSSRMKESCLLFLNERVKQADSDIALWMKHCNAAVFDNPEQCEHHFAFKNLMEAMEKKRVAQVELEGAMCEGQEVEPNKHQAYVDLTLDSHMQPASSKKAKLASSGSASKKASGSSVSITSVNVPNRAGSNSSTDNDNDAVTMSTQGHQGCHEGPLRVPDGTNTCLSTTDCEKLCGHYKQPDCEEEDD